MWVVVLHMNIAPCTLYCTRHLAGTPTRLVHHVSGVQCLKVGRTFSFWQNLIPRQEGGWTSQMSQNLCKNFIRDNQGAQSRFLWWLRCFVKLASHPITNYQGLKTNGGRPIYNNHAPFLVPQVDEFKSVTIRTKNTNEKQTSLWAWTSFSPI